MLIVLQCEINRNAAMNDPSYCWTDDNRLAWDERAIIHMRDSVRFYGIDRFRAGHDTLLPIVDREIGDVRGKRLVHLQCHIGIDVLCLARRGAAASGLDFSSESIAGARSLSSEMRIAANFVCGNVYDAPSLLAEKFDIVYVSWGSLNWLPDIWRWGEAIGALLSPGGHLYLIEQHPSAATLKEIDGQLHPYYSWRTPHDYPVVTEVATTYSGDQTKLEHGYQYEWEHPLSDIVGALIAAGLRLDFFHEHEALPWQRFSMMVPAEPGLFRMPDTHARMPLSFSLRASKP